MRTGNNETKNPTRKPDVWGTQFIPPLVVRATRPRCSAHAKRTRTRNVVRAGPRMRRRLFAGPDIVTLFRVAKKRPRSSGVWIRRGTSRDSQVFLSRNATLFPQPINRIAILVQMHEQVVIEKRVDQLEA